MRGTIHARAACTFILNSAVRCNIAVDLISSFLKTKMFTLLVFVCLFNYSHDIRFVFLVRVPSRHDYRQAHMCRGRFSFVALCFNVLAYALSWRSLPSKRSGNCAREWLQRFFAFGQFSGATQLNNQLPVIVFQVSDPLT